MLLYTWEIGRSTQSAVFRDYWRGRGFNRGVSSICFSPSYLGRLLTGCIEHTRDSSSSGISISRRPQWTPPSSARYSSFFDSGLQLSDGSGSMPLRSSSTTNSATSDSPAPRRGSARLPQELYAHDDRDLQAIQEAMKLQTERDRVRKEEVEPLEKRVRKLEESQLELTALLAGLRSTSSDLPPQSAGMASQDLDDAPLINLKSVKPSRTNTVRYENPKTEESSIAKDPFDP
jgi:hypothetical protein